MIKSTQEIMSEIAERVRRSRLSGNISQAGLAERSGVSVATLRLFERTGKISLESLVKLALALRAEEGFDSLFACEGDEPQISLDELIDRSKQRKRGRSR